MKRHSKTKDEVKTDNIKKLGIEVTAGGDFL